MANLLELVKQLRDQTGAGMMDCKKALEASDCDLDKAVDWLREKGIAKSVSRESRVAAEGLANITVDGNSAVLVEINTETDFTARNDRFKDLIKDVATIILTYKPATVEDALALPATESPVSELISAVSFATGEKMTLRRFEIVEKNDDQLFGQYVHHDGKTAAIVVLNGSNQEVGKPIAMQIASMKPQYVDRASMPQEIVEHETQVQTEIAKNDPNNANKPANIIEKMVTGRVAKALQEMCLVDQAFILDGNLKVSAYLKENGMSVDSFVVYVVGEGIEKRKDCWVDEVNAALRG
ncbi:MAG TPA: translation elongation factor Ts [Erysipelotrichaceae bacterium]|nr:translation elongation factor Ts [Erysipelotrichaceae bacterium]HQA85818.1 translation elongation factor Ts [Erysipelotrichaceae bacterium]